MPRPSEPATLPTRTAILIGGLVTPSLVLALWMLADDIGPAQALATPFPYMFFIIMWVLVIPVYLANISWLRISLARITAAGLLLALLPVLQAYSCFLLPRAHFAAFLVIGAALTGALSFWACLRLFSPKAPPRSQESRIG